MARTNAAMLSAFAVLALAQLASIQLMLLANRGGASAAGTFEPIEIQIADIPGDTTASRLNLDNEFEMTGNSFDWAIDGHGYFEVILEDGTSGYTRNGSFRCNAEGEIVTQEGFPLASRITLDANYLNLLVHYNGEVSVTQPEGAIQPVGRVQLARFMNPDSLRESRSSGVYLETEESGAPKHGTPGEGGFGTIEQGFQPVQPLAQTGGITVTIAPGREPAVTGSAARANSNIPYRTTKVRE